MTGPASTTAGALRWLALAEELLERAAPRLDALNVFPVPDADTGANMLATVRAARHGAEQTLAEVGDAPDLGVVFARAGAAALDAARGNSGTLLAVALDGLAPPLRGVLAPTTDDLAAAARGADRAARRALSDPQEGTILSVLSAAADTLERAAAQGADPVQAVENVVADARRAVECTEATLAALRRARVVDAGALGVLWVLEALRATVTGTPVDEHVAAALHGWTGADRTPAADAPTEEAAAGSGTPGVEVMCTVRLAPVAAAELRRGLEGVGDSVIIAPLSREPDGAGRVPWRVHVHVPRQEDALDLVRAAGEPEGVGVSDLAGGGGHGH